MTLYVALDVSLEKTAVCVMDAEGTPIIERAVPSEAAALAELLSTLPIDRHGSAWKPARYRNGWCAA